MKDFGMVSGEAKSLDVVIDVILHLQELVAHQLQVAKTEKTPMNQSVQGDATVKTLFLTLLSEDAQREVFMKTASKPEAWPRLKPWFGSPPYNFLRPEDSGMLRAGGIARGRVNMAYDSIYSVANVSQFGVGQFVDDEGRQYRVTSHAKTQNADPLPGGEAYVTHLAQKSQIFQVKVGKNLRGVGVGVGAGVGAGAAQRVRFPMPSDRIELRETPALLRMRGLQSAYPFTVVVQAIAPRAQASQTAAIRVRVV